jgi:DNA-3-methyladenine glycosylase
VFDRELLASSALDVAPRLLGSHLVHNEVRVRLTEVEAYMGDGEDPGSHAFRGQTPRTTVMFGEPGHLYAYFTYGMHVCVNIVCSPVGEASAVLLRAGEVIEGIDSARMRRLASRSDRDLAQGPARLAVALGIPLSANGTDLESGPLRLELQPAVTSVESGPRTGVSGPGGSIDFSWRFWIPGDPTVSPYKAAVPRKAVRGTGSTAL